MDTTKQVGILATNAASLAAVSMAVAMAGKADEPVRVPAGELGGCVGCGKTVSSHFQDGKWLGCPAGDPATVYILVPAAKGFDKAMAGTREQRGVFAATKAPAIAHEKAAAVEPVKPVGVISRGFRRARYVSGLRANANLAKLPLSETRRKVLRTVHQAGERGLLARQIGKRAKLPHGSVQQTLNWLRSQKLVVAHEDMPPVAEAVSNATV
jgi:DNA-binding transcriptional ArsR family regulator